MTPATERFERAVLLSSVVFLNSFSIYQYIFEYSTTARLCLVPFCIATGLACILYALLCLCYRGKVRLSEKHAEYESEPEMKTCNICMQWKPERAHHCSTCRACIKKMDHHCHWLGRCINYDNHGHFIRFLFFGFLNTLALLAFNIYYLSRCIFYNEFKITYNTAVAVVSSTMVSGLMCVVMCVHFSSQMYMMSKNVTFIEMLHFRNHGQTEEYIDESPYNISWLANARDTLGPAKYLFLGMPQGDGLFFRKKYEVHYWPKSDRQPRFREVV